jgi:uncharacterized protein YcnI
MTLPRSRLFAAALLLLCPFSAFAHATVSPSASRPGTYERYVLRVPNESDAPTIRVSIRFPDEVRVISFLDVPGWQLSATFDSTGRARTAVWTGVLPPERFVEFPFVGVNPGRAVNVSWPVTQVYANGQVVNWTGPRGSDTPASITVIGAGAPWHQWLPAVLAAFALLVAVLSLAITRRRAPGALAS